MRRVRLDYEDARIKLHAGNALSVHQKFSYGCLKAWLHLGQCTMTALSPGTRNFCRHDGHVIIIGGWPVSDCFCETGASERTGLFVAIYG